MATKQAQELRALDDVELMQRRQDAQNELINVRFGLATRQTENTAKLADARRDIARIRTILTERQQEA
jgi:large subunit ribosomal protein L29